jgi:hypothetical protein
MLSKDFTTDSIKGFLLLFLTFTANFLGTSLNCHIQKLLQNIYIKYFVIYFFIYFCINITSNRKEYPLNLWVNTTIIFILYVLLMRQIFVFFIINITIILLIYISSQYRNYYEKTEYNEDKIKHYEKIIEHLKIILIITILIGFLLYFVKQKNEKGNKFNLKTFIFGNEICDNLN